MKRIIFIVVSVIGLGILLYVSSHYFYREKLDSEQLTDFKAVSFTIGTDRIALKNGVAMLPPISDSASTRTIRYFGNELAHDLDGDGDLDMVFLVTDDGGGSGLFFYLVGARNTDSGYVGTQALFLGDRIAPQTTQAGPGTQVIVHFADRAPGEPMSAQPSVGTSMYVLFDSSTNDFGEVIQDYEGELDDAADLIRVDSPAPNAIVRNPITVHGTARGYWFFEASFPIVVVDWDGRIIGEGYATAAEDWMTEDFVPFTGTVEYDLPADTPYMRGAIIFKKDNPSGLPENDAAIEIPIVFEREKLSDNRGILPFDSGVYGQVLRGPICPVVQNPPQPECADQPFATTVQVHKKSDGQEVLFAEMKTNAQGEYSFQLPPGDYIVQAAHDTPFPSCQLETISIQPKVMQEVTLNCDTGIR